MPIISQLSARDKTHLQEHVSSVSGCEASFLGLSKVNSFLPIFPCQFSTEMEMPIVYPSIVQIYLFDVLKS